MNIESIQKKSGIVGRSDAIQQVLEMVSQVAPVDISVLIEINEAILFIFFNSSIFVIIFVSV